jgi:hypothetical protein
MRWPKIIFPGAGHYRAFPPCSCPARWILSVRGIATPLRRLPWLPKKGHIKIKIPVPENGDLIEDTKLVMAGKASSEYVNLRLL